MTVLSYYYDEISYNGKTSKMFNDNLIKILKKCLIILLLYIG